MCFSPSMQRNLIRPLGACWLALGLLLRASAALGASAADDPGAAVAGLQAVLTVERPDPSDGAPGPKVSFALVNVSPQPIRIFNRLEIRWPGTQSLASVALTITRADGTPYPPGEKIASLTAGPYPQEFVWLQPSEEQRLGPIPLLVDRGIRDSGKFRVTATYSNFFRDWFEDDGTRHDEPEVWVGSVVSNAVIVDVLY